MESEAKEAIGFCNLVEAVGNLWASSFRKVGMAEAIIYPTKHWVGNEESQDTGVVCPFKKAGSDKRKNNRVIEFSLDLYLNKMAREYPNMKDL